MIEWRRREWMGSGGPRGLQILLPGAKTIRGGFDSHTFPPFSIQCACVAGALLFYLLTPAHAVATDKIERDDPGAAPYGSAMRSLVFPGWGQLHNGSKKKAIALFSFETYLLSRAIITERRARYYNDRMGDAEPAWDTAYLEARYRELRDTHNDMVWWSAIVVLYSVLDAFVGAHLIGFDEDIEEVRRLTLHPETGPEGNAFLALRFAW